MSTTSLLFRKTWHSSSSNVGVSMVREELSVDLRTRKILLLVTRIERGIRPYPSSFVPVSTFLPIVEKYREFQMVENRERRRMKHKLSSRNIWKIVREINFNPSLMSTLHSNLSKFPSQHYREDWERMASQVTDNLTKKGPSSTGSSWYTN